MGKPNLVVEKSMEFALSVIELYKKLREEKEYVLSNQLLRAGTSIGANVKEATSAESKKDFIHKLSVSLKEAKESEYWLELLDRSELTKIDVTFHRSEAQRLIRIISSIIISTKKNMGK